MTRMEESLKAFVGIKRTNDILEKLVKNDAQQYGLNISEFAVMELLYHKGPQPINRIQERILIANSSTTYIFAYIVIWEGQSFKALSFPYKLC